MMHPLIRQMLPAAIADIFATVNKEDIVSNCASKRGEGVLILEQVKSARYTCIYDAIWPDIPESEDAVALMIFYVCLNAECTTPRRNRITELLHRGSGNPLLLFIQHKNDVYLSARFGEHFVKVLLPAQLPPDFVQEMDIRQGFPAHLRALYNRWICALYALNTATDKQLLAIAGNINYCALPTPQQAQQHHADVAALLQQLSAVRAQLNACRLNASKRVPLGNLRHSLINQLINLLPPQNENS